MWRSSTGRLFKKFYGKLNKAPYSFVKCGDIRKIYKNNSGACKYNNVWLDANTHYAYKAEHFDWIMKEENYLIQQKLELLDADDS